MIRYRINTMMKMVFLWMDKYIRKQNNRDDKMRRKVKNILISLLAVSMMTPVSVSAVDLPFVAVDEMQDQTQTETSQNTSTDPLPVSVTPEDPTPTFAAPDEPTPLPVSVIPSSVEPEDTNDPVTIIPDNTTTDGNSSKTVYYPAYTGYDHPNGYTAQEVYGLSPSISGKAWDDELHISARIDANGNITIEWDKVKQADKCTVYLQTGKSMLR